MVLYGVPFPHARSVGFATVLSAARAGLAVTAMAVMATKAMRFRIEASLASDAGRKQRIGSPLTPLAASSSPPTPDVAADYYRTLRRCQSTSHPTNTRRSAQAITQTAGKRVDKRSISRAPGSSPRDRGRSGSHGPPSLPVPSVPSRLRGVLLPRGRARAHGRDRQRQEGPSGQEGTQAALPLRPGRRLAAARGAPGGRAREEAAEGRLEGGVEAQGGQRAGRRELRERLGRRRDSRAVLPRPGPRGRGPRRAARRTRLAVARIEQARSGPGQAPWRPAPGGPAP